MRTPPEPPEPPHTAPASEPFPLTRTPPTGTLIGLSPPPTPPAAARPPAAAQRPPLAVVPPAPALAPESDLGRQLEGVRVELVYFRRWWPEQLAIHSLVRKAPPPAPPMPPRPSPGARWRSLQRRALALGAGAALALGVALASGAAALSWPAYGRLVATATYLGAPTAPACTR